MADSESHQKDIWLVIVLTTYNGECYLQAQLDSICEQTMTDWVLIARDDGSQDRTLAILHEYVQRDPRITMLDDDRGNLGTSGSFSLLMEHAIDMGAAYVACSDQDDVWLPGKLAGAYRHMRELEAQSGVDTPILVHSDLEVVDESLTILNPSYMAYENVAIPQNPPIETLLVQNHVVGCTMLANRALLKKSLPIPSEARMHDWWLGLCAKSIGILSYLPEAGIKYRQHRKNTIGASGFSLIRRIFDKAWWIKLQKWSEIRIRVARQASALERWLSIDERVSVVTGDGIRATTSIRCFDYGGLHGLACAWRAGLRGQNWLATLLFYIFFLRTGR